MTSRCTKVFSSIFDNFLGGGGGGGVGGGRRGHSTSFFMEKTRLIFIFIFIPALVQDIQQFYNVISWPLPQKKKKKKRRDVTWSSQKLI